MTENTNEKLANLYDIARQAKACGDHSTALKYYCMILNEDPFCWEPVFYSVYYTVFTMKNGEIGNKAVEISNCLSTTLSMVSTRVDNIEDKKSALLELKDSTLKISSVLKRSSEGFYNSLPAITRNPLDKLTRTILIGDILFTMADALYSYGTDELNLQSEACEVYKQAVWMLETEPTLSGPLKIDIQYQPIVDKMTSASTKVREFDPDFKTKKEAFQERWNNANTNAKKKRSSVSTGDAPSKSEPKTTEPTTNSVEHDSDAEERNKSAGKILTLGICSVLFSCSFWLAIVGWILGGICKNKVKEHEARFGPVSGKAKVGKCLGVGGTIGGIIMTILSFICCAFYLFFFFIVAFL